MLLENKIALVTGGSAGMGKDIVLSYLNEGAIVIATARRAEKLEALRQLTEHNDRLFLLPGDVSHKEDIDRWFDFIEEKFGRIDIVVNNAGIMDNMEPIADVTDEVWEKMMAVNLDGPFWICRRAIKMMLEQEQEEKGIIINVASGGGIGGGRSGAAYTASKFGLVGLSRNIAYMYAPQGIRCNIICPGAVQTEIGSHMTNVHPYGMKRVREGVQNNRIGQPQEIADLAVYLASDKSTFINGATIVADGGKGAW